MKQYLSLAKKIALDVGSYQLGELRKKRTIRYKGKFDIVTEVDKECERRIVTAIRQTFPGHDILAEEGSNRETDSDWRWIIDPLDGTVNYSHRYPLFCVSIALQYRGETVVGVVYEPNRGELFTAIRGEGAFLNEEEKLQVSDTPRVYEAMIATGFGYNVAEAERNNIPEFNRFITQCHALRRDGVAAVDLCYIACGRYDGFWELYLHPWDIAAGGLIIEEAGGRVSNFDGSPLDIFGIEIVASNGRIHQEMLKILQDD